MISLLNFDINFAFVAVVTVASKIADGVLLAAGFAVFNAIKSRVTQ